MILRIIINNCRLKRREEETRIKSYFGVPTPFEEYQGVDPCGEGLLCESPLLPRMEYGSSPHPATGPDLIFSDILFRDKFKE
ncbi:hypothetical protein [Leptospira wolffii]|uniref:hypothetical protein n=1 Tax=Leptospira wolffii TaxID=409998 RepID=UPI00058DE5FD|nr:hypothetical protein [Leptospira wolffii]